MSEISINFKINGVDNATKSIDQLSTSTDGLNTSVSNSSNSVKTYTQQIKALQKDLIALGGRTNENAAEFDRLTNSILQLKENQEDLTRSTNKLDNVLSGIPGPVGASARAFQLLDNTVKNSRAALISITKQFPLLRNAFVATGIGAIVVIFGLLTAGVIKAFNSFEPLKTAVGNLGIAFNLLGKITKPLVDLIGKGLTIAVNGLAKGIAFLTGNMKEYNAEVEKAAAAKELEQQLIFEAKQWDIIKDGVDEYTRALRDAYNLKEERIKEINDMEVSAEQKAILIRNAEVAYLKVIERENKKADEKKKESLKLTAEQIKQQERLQELALGNLRKELDLLKAKAVGDVENVKILEQLNQQIDNLQKLLDNSKPKIEVFNDRLNKLFGEQTDEGAQKLNELTIKLYDSIYTLTTESDFDKFQKEAVEAYQEIAKQTDIFSDKTILQTKSLTDNIITFGTIINEVGKSTTDYYQIIKANELDLTSSQVLTIEKRLEIQKREDEARKKFVDDYVKVLVKRKDAETGVNITQENATKLAEEQADNLKELIKFNLEYEIGIKSVNIQVEEQNKKIRELIQNQGVLGQFVLENSNEILSLFISTMNEATQNSSKMLFDYNQFYTDLISKFPDLVNLTQSELNFLFDEYKKKYISIGNELDVINKGFFGTELDRMKLQLEAQKEADKERLRQAGATAQQLSLIDEMYHKKKLQLEAGSMLMAVEFSNQALGMVAEQLDKNSGYYRALKYTEAVITAISSSIRMYESVLTYSGPAGPVLAPILAATSLTTQMIAANKILQVPEPQQNKQKGSGPGPNPTYTGYYEDGGMVFGPRHRQGGVNANLEGGEYIINRRSMMLPGVAEMASSLNNMSNILTNPAMMYKEPPVVKAYVVSKEMTNQQSADKRIKNLSRL
jgi:hypothetical protein